MKFGLSQNIPWPETAEQKAQFDRAIKEAVLAEELGFSQVNFTEHHFSRHSLVSSSLAVLSHLAALTTRIRLGTSIITLPFHNPVRLAEEAAIVDLLSDGRLEMGLGRGFMWAEYNGFDMSVEESAERSQEALDVLLKAWTEQGRFSHKGPYFSFNNVSVEPKPLQKPYPPISLAVTSPDSAIRAGRMGFKAQLPRGISTEQIADRIERYKAGLAEGGFEYHPENVSVAGFLHLAASKEQAWEEMSSHYRWFRRTVAGLVKPAAAAPANPFAPDQQPKDELPLGDRSILFGTPDDCARYIEELEKVGVGLINVGPNLGPLPFESAVATIRLFASEVMPHFVEQPVGAV